MLSQENLGPAERIIQASITYADHIYHGRPGLVTADAYSPIKVKWQPVTYKVENDQKVVYLLNKVGKKVTRTRMGVMGEDKKVRNGTAVVGEYRDAGLFPEVAAYLYQQVADVWKLDNEFAARWASYAYKQTHRDFKVVLAAFMLVQSRKGDPVIDDGKVAFHDDDFRDVGEAMILNLEKDNSLSPKHVLRVHEFLNLPQVAKINRDLGFGASDRHAFTGRWERAVTKYLSYREENPKLLEGLVRAGFRTTIMELARRVGFKPSTTKFFEALRWKQNQAKDGRRAIAIGAAVAAAESWAGLTEEQICLKIVEQKPNFKRLVGLLPKEVGVTRAVVAAAIEAGAMSDKDLVIYTPTLEELGLLEVKDIKKRWEKALKAAEDTRAANIATRVKSKAVAEKLEESADKALQKAAEEVTRGLRIYFVIDISGSMTQSLELAKEYISKFLQAFPLDRTHVAVFNTAGRIVEIKHASKAGVTNAFKGVHPGGGTAHAAGVKTVTAVKPGPDEDALFIFVGDEEEGGNFVQAVRQSGVNPMAFGLIRVGNSYQRIVQDTASALGIPCFMISNETFSDVYAIPRTIRALVASTPVGKVSTPSFTQTRVTLVDQILKSELLKKPVWA